MRDIVLVAVALAFFGVCVAYVQLCDRIIGPDPDETAPAGTPAAGIPAAGSTAAGTPAASHLP